MLTDAPPPRRKDLPSFLDSDQRTLTPLPPGRRLPESARAIDSAMKKGTTGEVQRACAEFLRITSGFYGVPECSVLVLAARPLRVREHSTIELFGDYHPDTLAIRIWKQTAVRKEITSFGTFPSTLCHEFCHHLDFHRFRFRNSWHTRGFFELRRCCITTHEERRPRSSSGHQSQAVAGESIGRARIKDAKGLCGHSKRTG
jgi:hypothetical protein